MLLVKVLMKNGQQRYSFIGSVLKTNPWTSKIKNINVGKDIATFYEKNCCWVYYK